MIIFCEIFSTKSGNGSMPIIMHLQGSNRE